MHLFPLRRSPNSKILLRQIPFLMNYWLGLTSASHLSASLYISNLLLHQLRYPRSTLNFLRKRTPAIRSLNFFPVLYPREQKQISNIRTSLLYLGKTCNNFLFFYGGLSQHAPQQPSAVGIITCGNKQNSRNLGITEEYNEKIWKSIGFCL